MRTLRVLVVFVVMLQLAVWASAAPLAGTGTGRVQIQLDSVPVAELVTILFRDVLRTPYVVAPEVGTDRRTVSVRLDAVPADARKQIVAYLGALGVNVASVGGVDQVTSSARPPSSPFPSFSAPTYSPPVTLMPQSGSVTGASGAPSDLGGNPLSVPTPVAATAVYIPRYRDPTYLGELLRSLFPDLKLGAHPNGVAREGETILPQTSPDVLVFGGSEDTVHKAKALARELDTEQVQLTIKATVYEVQTGHTNASALQLALNVLGGKLSLGSLGGLTPLDSVIRLATQNITAVFSALNQDSRFHVVTSPSVMTRSGAQAVLTSGSQVPVLGAVSYQGENGRAVQSVEYRDSGVILKVRPTVHLDVIDLDVSQELSSFVRTETGVNASPTLNKRSLVNQLSLRSGDVVCIGGLTEDRSTKTRSGILPGILGARSSEKTRTEILLVLQVVALAGGSTDVPARNEVSTGHVLETAVRAF